MPRKEHTVRPAVRKRRQSFRIAVVHLGCAKNQVDTERIMGMLGAAGFPLTGDVADAEAVLVTTCSFISPAVGETEELLESLVSLKSETGRPRVLVAGCLVDRFGAAELASRFPQVDCWVHAGDYLALPRVLESLFDGKPPAALSGDRCVSLEFEQQPRLPAAAYYAYLKIAEGCSNRCHYCTIPQIRGQRRPVPAALLVREAQALADMGVRELVLVAQDVAAYRDPDTGRSLPHLVEELSRIAGIRWIRLMYLHPAHLEGVIEAFTVSEKVLAYADLPIQHASDAVLAAMGRGYVRSDLERVIERLRSARPGIALRTTVMLGHPGEAAAAFAALMDFMERVRFLYVGGFVYSPEAGTWSAQCPGRPAEALAAERLDELMSLQREITGSLLDAQKGQVVEAINDGDDARAWFQAPEVDGMLTGAYAWPPGVFGALITGRRQFDLTGEPVI